MLFNVPRIKKVRQELPHRLRSHGLWSRSLNGDCPVLKQTERMGPTYAGHASAGHTYVDHTYVGHDYTGHSHIDHDPIDHTVLP